MASIENLASQAINMYKGNGRYVFYVEAGKRIRYVQEHSYRTE